MCLEEFALEYERVQNPSKNWVNDRLHFYKYVSASTAKIVLQNRTLRWSAPLQLNDPFDIQFNMRVPSSVDEVKSVALQRLWDVYEGRVQPDLRNPMALLFQLMRVTTPIMSREELFSEFGPAIEEGFERMTASLPSVHADTAKIFENVKILCLTTTPDNALMWSHYADAHRGVVIRFRSIPAFDTPYGMAKPVRYVNEVPALVSAEELADILAGSGVMDTSAILERATHTKSNEWAYENEWRINSGAGRQPGEQYEDVPFGDNELDGVIFGLRTTSADKEDLRALINEYPNVDVMTALRRDDAFGLEIVPYHPD